MDYAQEVEKEFDKLQIVKEIHRNDNNKKNDKKLQNIWNSIESSIKKASKKIIPIKKIKCINKPIINNKGHTAFFKSLRKVINILLLIKELQKKSNLILLNQINKEINLIAKIFSLFDFKNIDETDDLTNISRNIWKLNLKKNIKIIKEINYKEEAFIKDKEIKKVIQKRCQNLQTD